MKRKLLTKLTVIANLILLVSISSCNSKIGTRQINEAMTKGMVKPGFEEVREEFINNFSDRNEIGAACCIYYKGEKVVDLWGGIKDKKTNENWEENTIVKVFSTTKGMSLLCLARLHSDGLLDYSERVAHYWPEFGKNGKEDITVEQLLTHKGGLVLLERKIVVSELNNFNEIAILLENASPMWTPGTKHGYHSSTIGLYIQQLVQRIDPAGRSVGNYFREEIALPLDADFYIGLPSDFDSSRLASLKELVPPLALFNMKKVPKGLLRQLIKPSSLMMKSFMQIKNDTKDPIEELQYEEASGGGAGEARALAHIYGVLSYKPGQIGVKPETMDLISKRTSSPLEGNYDYVMGFTDVAETVCWSVTGFAMPDEVFNYGSRSSFGFYGSGGSFAFADPEHEIGYAYIMNRMDFYTQKDPREIALREAMYRCIERIEDK